jgi:prepilin-type processing-associated H-X9-DG protein
VHAYGGNGMSNPVASGLRLDQVAAPAEWIMLMEGNGSWTEGNPCGGGTAGTTGCTSQAHGFIRTDAAATRHNGGSNYGFGDGHVKWMTPTSIPCNDAPGKCMWSIEDPG